MLRILIACLALMFTTTVDATTRSHAQRAAFQRMHPCPANGLKRGACPGYVVDHIIALCVGGIDRPTNMQWQTVAAAKVKDRIECKRPNAAGLPK